MSYTTFLETITFSSCQWIDTLAPWLVSTCKLDTLASNPQTLFTLQPRYLLKYLNFIPLTTNC